MTTETIKQYFASMNYNVKCMKDEMGCSIYELIGTFWSYVCSGDTEAQAWTNAYNRFEADYQ